MTENLKTLVELTESKLIKFSDFKLKEINYESEEDMKYVEAGNPYLYQYDETLGNLIKQFNPAYVVWAGEDSTVQSIGYPKIELMAYKMQIPQGLRMAGIYPSIEYFKTSNGYGLFLGQCEPCNNLSLIFLHEEDKELAKLLSIWKVQIDCRLHKLHLGSVTVDELQSEISKYMNID